MRKLIGISVAVVAVLAGGFALDASASSLRWGSDGHEMAGRAAAESLPDDLPAFFRSATDQLVYLNPEPDRWRNRDRAAMDQAFSYDHYVDLENVPPGALDAPDRFEYLKILYAAGLPKPERDAGFLYFHILELYDRLVTEWELWAAAAGAEREWIEERIINDAGILGHYVTDASQPHHTTIHFNGWNASSVTQVANPEGFTQARDFHGRFESGFVRVHVDQEHVTRTVRPLVTVRDVRDYTLRHILQSNALVTRLYRLEKEHGFDPEASAHPAEVAFAAERLGAGASALRDLWVAAWREGTGG